MKKRILSILLTLCMTLCLTPISVFAEEVGAGGSAAIQLGADALSVLSKNVNTATAPTVYFGQNHENNPAAWRVIGYDGSGVTSSKGDITLLAAGAMGVIPFVDTILNNEYAPSNLKTAIDALAEKLTTEENAAVKKRTLTSGSYDGENTDCVAGGQVDNAVFWPLSAKEAIAVNNDLRALNPAHPNWVDSGWWLRSPGSDKYRLAVVRSEGSVQYSGFSVLIFNNHRTVRPAFNLNLNSVLFASAAVGGKPDGGLTPIPEYSGNEWKLTLLDSRRNFAVTEKTVSAVPDDTVTLNYKGATRGKNEYISVILADNNGAQYYGRVAQPTTESGTVEIKIPSDIAPGDYTMKVFSEQYNGDCKTDLASAFADVTLTVESQPDEQFTLAPGGRYYFDLSAMDIPGTVNSNLPDSTLHYVPFTYAGTVDAYVLKPASNHVEDSSEQASVTKDKNAQYGYAYEHSLFIADYRVTTNISWIDLNNAGFIFGKTNTAGGINYTLRAPTMGSIYKSPMRGAPANNEWDQILTKNSDFIKELDNNRNISLFWGQDTSRSYDFNIRKTTRNSVNNFMGTTESSNYGICFRPVLEVLNSDTLGSDGLEVVTLDLGGGTLGNSSEDIQIIVKTGSEFTAPASDGLNRPDGDTGNFFMWRGSNGKFYVPGDSVPADVTALTVQWTDPTYAVTLHPNGGTINNGNVTEYIYGVGATLPTADDMTYTGHTFKGWYDNESLTGDPVTAIGGTEMGNKEYWAKWEINQYTITFDTAGGSEIAPITQDYGTAVTAPEPPAKPGYTFTGWNPALPATMPAENLTVTAQWTVNQYTITFATDGGSEVAPITQDYGSAITAPAAPTREGYTFTGWDKTIPATMPAGDMTITVQWTVNQYTIIYDLDGGTAEGNPDTYTVETDAFTLKNPTRPGHTFTGWSGTGLTGEDNLTLTIPKGSTGNRSYTAHWSLNTYSITYDLNGGTASGNPTSYTVESATITLNQPTKTGYTFTGWSGTDLTGEDNLTVTIPAGSTGDRSYTAHWSLNTYSITYDLDGGTASGNPDFYTVESSTITLNPPTRTGYTFIGWSGTDLSGSDNLTVTIPTGSIGNRSYTAHWSLNTYSITYDLDGGTAFGNPDSYTVESAAITLNEPTKAGYVFTGWSGTDLVGEDNLTVTIPAGSSGDRRYTAHWEFDPTIIAALNPTPNVDFLDVSRTDWFYYDVRYVCENGLMNGTSRNRFSPYGTATRGMLVTILYRMENEPRCFGSAAFSDVKPGAYYEKAVVWASQNNIVSGYTDGTFRPDAPVTREQLASILYRYTLYRGQDVSAGETTSLTGYGDAQAVSSYALPAMRWACGTGLLHGANGKLNPSGLATRAQLAAMLHRYLTK